MNTAYAQQKTLRPRLSKEAFQQVRKGDVIIYLLASSEHPTHPLKEWHGRVEALYGELVVVAVLDVGYEGEGDMVNQAEILFVTRALKE